jgi:hypothetical protein
VPNLSRRSAYFSFGQRIVTWGRTKLLAMMERIADTIVRDLKAESSQDMGGFKIEAVAEHGLWPAPGRYWLYSGSVLKFGDQGVGDGTGAVQDRRDACRIEIHRRPQHSDESADGHGDCMSIAKGMTWDDGIGSWRHEPICLVESTGFEDFLATLDANRDAVVHKLDAFERLKAGMCQ